MNGMYKSMTPLADSQYTLVDFNRIINNYSTQPLPQSISQKIKILTEKVGAPSYSRTPNFKKGRRNNRIRCNAENWEAMRNFKATDIKKNTEGVEKLIDDIILLLNKITKNNYDNTYISIVKIMQDVEKNKYKEGDLIKLGESIFLIGSSNDFYSKLYSRLYKDLIRSFPFMKAICLKNFKKFLPLFDNIEWTDAEENYEKFCTINKNNERRRALSLFFVNLMIFNIIECSAMVELILNLINKQEMHMNNDDEKKIVDEISENLFLLIIQGKKKLSISEQWNFIKMYITKITNLNTKEKPSLSQKTKFKFMDIYEMI